VTSRTLTNYRSGRLRDWVHSCLFALEVESLNERIQEYDRRIEGMYPETALPKQVRGIGDLIAMGYVLTIEDPHRFRKSASADVLSGCGLGGGTLA
jgi:hypothetical protein